MSKGAGIRAGASMGARTQYLGRGLRSSMGVVWGDDVPDPVIGIIEGAWGAEGGPLTADGGAATKKLGN